MVTVPVRDVQPITPRSRLVTLDLEGLTLDFRAGQAVLVGTEGTSERRPYSIACSPERAAERGCLELLISVEPDGSLGGTLGSVTRGSIVDVDGPTGTFTLPPEPRAEWLLFVAGGTGIAPLRSMLDHLLRGRPAHRVALLYSARRMDEFAFMDELKAHSDAGVLELHQTVTRDESTAWTGSRGRIGPAHFEAVLHQPAETLCFVCGPESLVNESVATLSALGVPRPQVKTESWGR